MRRGCGEVTNGLLQTGSGREVICICFSGVFVQMETADQNVVDQTMVTELGPRQNKKYCFVTALVYPSDATDMPVPAESFASFDFVLFTNRQLSLDGWEVIVLPEEEWLGYIQETDSSQLPFAHIYMSRYPKFMGWDYFAKNNRNYDVIFWIDGYFCPKSTENWDLFAKKIQDSESGILQQQHPLDPHIECDNIVRFHKDTKARMEKMKHYLKQNGCPHGIPMMQNGVFGYNPKNTKLTNAFRDFWSRYTGEKITYRDQPLWGLVSWIHKITPITSNRLDKCVTIGKRTKHSYV